MHGIASDIPADIDPRPRLQFSIRVLLAATAIVAALIALALAGLRIFLIQLLLSAVFAATVFIFARRAVRKTSPAQIGGMVRVFLVLAVIGVVSSLWLSGQTLTDALMHFGAAAGAIGGYLAAAEASGRLAGSWRYVFGGAVVLLLVAWGALHAIERGYYKQAQRETVGIQTAGLSWSWTGDGNATRDFGPLRLFRFPTLAVHDWRGGATDASLEALSKLELVSSLDVRDSQITDAGLAHLKSLHNLQSLDVRGTKVSSAALDDLRRVLPNLTCVKH